jgi:hypothetical protein
MEHDLWRQWQAFAGLIAPPGQSQSSASPQGAAFGFAPFIDAAERFGAAARSFSEGKDASAAGAAAAAQTFGNFLRDQFADLFKLPWPMAFATAPSASPPFPADAPALGLTREHQQRAQRAAEAWQRMEAAQRRLQRLWADTLQQAAAAFVARLGSAQTAPLSADALNRLYDTWIDCAEEAYARTAHSEAFCDAMADYVNAGSQWRRESNAGIEQWAKLLDLPTRNEINTLAERLRSVEEQLKRREGKPKTAARKPRRAPLRKPRKAKP